MPLYDFRLRFNFPEAYRIDSNADEIELLDLSPKEHITLVSDVRGTPIKDHNRAAVLGKSFGSEEQARTAAEKSKLALLYWAIKQRTGIDFGDGKQRSYATAQYLAKQGEKYGCPVRNDIHGIDIYKHVKKLMFVSTIVKATVGKYPPRLTDTFQREYLNNRHLTEKHMLACEIYASSFFDISPRSRFITLVTAVESLLELPKRSDKAEALVEEFKAKTTQSTLDRTTINSIIGSLERVKYQSYSQAGRALAHQYLPSELFDERSSADFFTRAYDLRSQILHHGMISDDKDDIWHLSNVMEKFVNQLLLAVLEKH